MFTFVLTEQELKDVIGTLGEIPAKHSGGLLMFFLNKEHAQRQEFAQKQQEAPVPEITPEIIDA